MSFYTKRNHGFLGTALSKGPWNPAHQHGGTVAGLLTSVLESQIERGFTAALLHAEFLRPVPVGYSEVSTEPTRESASIRGLRATLRTIDRPVATLTGMWVKNESAMPASSHIVQGPVRMPEECEKLVHAESGYASTLDVRVVSGVWQKTDHFCAWMRLNATLLPGEPVSPLATLMTLVDSCAGLAQPVDIRSYTFLNPDLMVRLHRAPEGEWFCIDARSTSTAHGLGLSEARLFDRQGFLGTASQTLLIRKRPGAF
jgi:acyl-CoA thioesterase